MCHALLALDSKQNSKCDIKCKYCCDLHFTEVETEVMRKQITCPRPPAGKWQHLRPYTWLQRTSHWLGVRKHPGPSTSLSHVPLLGTCPSRSHPQGPVWGGPARDAANWILTSVLTASSEGLIRTTVSKTSLRWWRIFCPAGTKTQTKEETFSSSRIKTAPPASGTAGAFLPLMKHRAPGFCTTLGHTVDVTKQECADPSRFLLQLGPCGLGLLALSQPPSFQPGHQAASVCYNSFSLRQGVDARKTQQGSWHFLSHGNWGCFSLSAFLLVRTVLRLIRSLMWNEWHSETPANN